MGRFSGTSRPGLDRALVRDVGALVAATGLTGISFGAVALAAGLPSWAAVVMSLLIFAGGSQFMAVGMMAAGSPVAAVLGGLLLNARHFPFGIAIASVFGRRPAARLLGAHLMTDEAVAFSLAQDDPVRRRSAYWLTGTAVFAVWNLGTVLGMWLGRGIGDPAVWGLDAAFPAALLALLMPSVREHTGLLVALVGAAVAVAATPFLPAGLPVLLALTGLLVAVRWRADRRPEDQPGSVGEEQ